MRTHLNPGTISGGPSIVLLSNMLSVQSMGVVAQEAEARGIEVQFATENGTFPPENTYQITAPPPLPEMPVEVFRKESYKDRAESNQPWYARFQKKRRRR